MANLKSERHHWWPESLSDFWKDEVGRVHWLLPDASVKHLPPKNCGVIVGGHHIKMGTHADEATVWGESFEHEFQDADSGFPGLIRWLQSLDRQAVDVPERKHRFLPQAASQEQVRLLIECLVSLAVRSPMNREAAVSLAERLRGPLPEQERNLLIGANMRHSYRRALQAFGTRGKIAVIFSPDREFIFGDGFFHNLLSPNSAPSQPQILAPLTPEISVLYARPFQYRTAPQLSTLVITADEAVLLNNAVQVYARKVLFYRSEPPRIIDDYRQGSHKRYNQSDHPIDQIIHDLSGM
jgi:hypothetical protein